MSFSVQHRHFTHHVLGVRRFSCTIKVLGEISHAAKQLYMEKQHTVPVLVGVLAQSALVWINEVNLRCTQLVVELVTVSWHNSRCGTFISVCNWPSYVTVISPDHPFMGLCGSTSRRGVKAGMVDNGSCDTSVGGRYNWVMPLLQTGHIWAL